MRGKGTGKGGREEASESVKGVVVARAWPGNLAALNGLDGDHNTKRVIKRD